MASIRKLLNKEVETEKIRNFLENVASHNGSSVILVKATKESNKKAASPRWEKVL